MHYVKVHIKTIQILELPLKLQSFGLGLPPTQNFNFWTLIFVKGMTILQRQECNFENNLWVLKIVILLWLYEVHEIPKALWVWQAMDVLVHSKWLNRVITLHSQKIHIWKDLMTDWPSLIIQILMINCWLIRFMWVQIQLYRLCIRNRHVLIRVLIFNL